jgi:hypothetical protein
MLLKSHKRRFLSVDLSVTKLIQARKMDTANPHISCVAKNMLSYAHWKVTGAHLSSAFVLA